jgi:hypothetical protein
MSLHFCRLYFGRGNNSAPNLHRGGKAQEIRYRHVTGHRGPPRDRSQRLPRRGACGRRDWACATPVGKDIDSTRKSGVTTFALADTEVAPNVACHNAVDVAIARSECPTQISDVAALAGIVHSFDIRAHSMPARMRVAAARATGLAQVTWRRTDA